VTCSQSAASSRVSEASILASSARECALCGSASRTRSAEGFLPGTGPVSRVIPTCAPLWPTPSRWIQGEQSVDGWRARRDAVKAKGINGNGFGIPLDMAVRMDPMTWNEGSCPCRCHLSTSSAAGSPARTSASPAAGPDWPENARVFGGSSQGSLGNYDPATSSLRTSQLSLLEDSTSSLQILPRAGSMRSGTIFQRRPLAPLTDATASGSWPTPNASPITFDGPHLSGDGRSKPNKLGWAVAEAERAWPTPTARLGTGRGPQAKRYHDPARSNDLDDAVAASGEKGSLNPAWVCWLMGFPPGWVDTGTESPTSDESR
jgi:hypothetical protein